MDPSKDYADIARGIEGFLNFQPLLNSIQGILDGYFPAAYLIAFVLLVVGTMREFLFPETRRFMQNLLRAVLLVGTISFLPSFMDWCDQAFKALAELPGAQTIAFGDSHYAVKAGSDGSNVTAIEQVLESKIAVSKAGRASSPSNRSTQRSPQLSWNPLDFGKNVETAWNYVVGRGVNLVWQILFAIYLLCLLLCKFIIVMMQFLQKVTIMGFKLYAPIGVAEYAHHSLKSKSTAISYVHWHYDMARGLEHSQCSNFGGTEEYSRSAGSKFRHSDRCYCPCDSGSALGCDWAYRCACVYAEDRYARRRSYPRICGNDVLRGGSRFDGCLCCCAQGLGGWGAEGPTGTR